MKPWKELFFEEVETPLHFHIGMRIIKTVLAVFICSIIGWLRGEMTFFSMIAAVLCMQKSAEKVNTLQSRLEALKEMESRYQELKQEVSIDLLSLFLQHEELQSQFSARQIFVQDEISREELKRLREDNGALRGKLEAVEIACLLNDRPRLSRRISRSSCSSCAAKTRSYENVRFAASSSHPQSSRASCEAWK